MFSVKSKIYLVLFILIMLFSLVLSYFSGIVKPIIYSKCESVMKLTTEKHISDALTNISNMNLLTDIIDFNHNSEGIVSGYCANTYKTTLLRSTLSSLLIGTLKEETDIRLTIPIGTLSGIPFLYGAGKNIIFKLTEFGFVSLDIQSEFLACGINQTLYKLYLNVETTTYIKELFGKKQIKLSTKIPLSETVLLGDVPEAYTVIVRASNDDEEDINDFGAHVPE